MILCEIAELGLLRPFHFAGFGGKVAHERAQQSCFATAVGADDGQALACVEQEIHVFEQRFVIAVTQTLHGDRLAMQLVAVVHFKADKRILAAGGFNVIQLDFLDLTGTRSSLARFGCVGGKTRDEGLQFGDFFLFLGIVGQHTFAYLRGSGHVIVIVTGVDTNFAIIQIGHVGTYAVQKMPVMRDDDNGAVARV